MPKIKLGGKAIDAGGFGCVFKPALKCSGSSERKPEHISKLMIKKYADAEMAEISRFLPIITAIPNHTNYFIISGISQCQPDSLDASDLDEFDDKCKNLVKKGFSASTINGKLDELGMLTIADGGVSIKNYITKTEGFDEEFFHQMNGSLIQLLKHGVVPMNARNLFHCDLKSDNILIKENAAGTKIHSRIIDWGLANVFTNNTIFYNRPLQFNVPIGSILLSNEFINFLMNELRFYRNMTKKSLTDYPPTDTTYTMIASKWLCAIVLKKSGHYEFIKQIIESVYEQYNQKCGFDMRDHILIDHLATIIKEFTNLETARFNIDAYIKTVYSKNIDVFGLIISYFPLLGHLNNPNGKYLNFEHDNRNNLINALCFLFDKYIFDTKYAITPYDVDEIVNDLMELSNILGFDVESVSPSHASLMGSLAHATRTRSLMTGSPPRFIPSFDSISPIPSRVSSHHTPAGVLSKFSSHHTPKTHPRFSSVSSISKLKSKTRSKSKSKTRSKSKSKTRKSSRR